MARTMGPKLVARGPKKKDGWAYAGAAQRNVMHEIEKTRRIAQREMGLTSPQSKLPARGAGGAQLACPAPTQLNDFFSKHILVAAQELKEPLASYAQTWTRYSRR